MGLQKRWTLIEESWDADGNRSEPKYHRSTYTALNEKSGKTIDLAASGTVTIWDPTVDAGETVQGFEYLFVKSDKDIHVEFTINEGHASETVFTVKVPAGRWVLLPSDVAYYNGGFAGTLDVIDKVRLKELNAVAAKVRWEIGR